MARDTFWQKRFRLVRPQWRDRDPLPVTMFLALSFTSALAHADDNLLIREANAALAQKDYAAAFRKLAVLAQHGNPIAEFDLGAFYFNGQGVERDEKQAFDWFEQSAAQGNAGAMQFIQREAAMGNPYAENELHRLGPEMARSQPQPYEKRQQASSPSGDDDVLIGEANAALAQKDYRSAFSRFAVLAQHGNAIAQYDLGAFYFNGQGVQRDERQAFDWFERSAAQGYAPALKFIQGAARNGNGNAKDAYKLLAQSTPAAAAPGRPDAEANGNAVTANASHAGPGQSGDPSSSRFSLGVSGGLTRKMTGIDNSPSFGLLGNYRFDSHFGVEVAYNVLYQNANANGFISTTNPGATGTFDLNAVSAAVQYTYPLTSQLSVLGNLGFHRSRYELKINGFPSRSGTSTGLVGGLKVQYDLTSSIGLRGGFDTYDEGNGLTGTVTEISAALIYQF